MKFNKLSQALLIAACFTASAASAAEISYTNSNTVLTQDTNLTDMLKFQQFDPSLGKLTSITIEVGSKVTGSVRLINGLDEDRIIPVSLDVDLFLERPDHSLVLSLLGTNILGPSYSIAANETLIKSNSVMLSATKTLDSLSDLQLFLGTGSLSAPLLVTAASFAEGDDLGAKFATQADGYGKITYTYTAAVPEPETYGMMLMGLGMLAFVSKRKARATQA